MLEVTSLKVLKKLLETRKISRYLYNYIEHALSSFVTNLNNLEDDPSIHLTIDTIDLNTFGPFYIVEPSDGDHQFIGIGLQGIFTNNKTSFESISKIIFPDNSIFYSLFCLYNNDFGVTIFVSNTICDSWNEWLEENKDNEVPFESDSIFIDYLKNVIDPVTQVQAVLNEYEHDIKKIKNRLGE